MLDAETIAKLESLAQEAAEQLAAQQDAGRLRAMLDDLREELLGENNFGGSGYGAELSKDYTGPFAPVRGASGVESLTNCYYQAGGYTRKIAEDPSIAANTSGVVALRYDATQQSDSGEVVVYADLAAVQAAQADQHYVIVPLYVMEDSEIVVDLRLMPHVQVAEAL